MANNLKKENEVKSIKDIESVNWNKKDDVKPEILNYSSINTLKSWKENRSTDIKNENSL